MLSCTTSGCHAALTNSKYSHLPVKLGRCQVCHEATPGSTPFDSGQKHAFRRIIDDPRLCYRCHDSLEEKTNVHAPVRSGMCVLCHDPHGSDHRFHLRAGTDQELCQQCHKEVFKQGDHLHGPVKAGACGACHDPHQSDNKFRLRESGTRECALCHAADLREIGSAATTHAPVEQRCINCHEPHRGTRRFRLTDSPPGLCLDCHDDIARSLAASSTLHRPVETGECLSCHDQHGSDFNHVLKLDPPSLCLGCHKDLGARLESEPVVHEPVKEGKCLECHEHHGGDHRRILRGGFSGEPYVPFSIDQFELCYRCHKPDHVTKERTTLATGFRNGNLNLHFKHVNNVRRGRTCGICHDVHSAGHPKLIRDWYPYGDWDMPLGFQQTATGGSCAPGCHVPKGYDRVSPVENK